MIEKIYVILKDGEFFGTALDYEAAFRDVEDNIDRCADDSAEQYARFSIREFTDNGECSAPRPR